MPRSLSLWRGLRDEKDCQSGRVDARINAFVAPGGDQHCLGSLLNMTQSSSYFGRDGDVVRQRAHTCGKCQTKEYAAKRFGLLANWQRLYFKGQRVQNEQ